MSQSFPLASYREVLAGKAPHHNIHTAQRLNLRLCDLSDVAEVRNVRVVVAQYRARERIDFSHADTLPAKLEPRLRGGLDAREQR